jgi:ribosome biogenesis GTPase
MIKGVILKGIGGFYYVDTEEGIFECRARGIFRKEGIVPTVGDYVEITVLDALDKKGSLDTIYDRKTELIRPKVANVNQAVIVFAAKNPNINIDLLDRFLILAEEQGLDIVICINKIDQDLEKNYERIANLYKTIGYPVVCTSVEKKIGLEELCRMLEHKISVFAGPSGVGKSSLINGMFPALQLTTGEISRKIQRGRHTTRHAELIQVEHQSYIVDSPGFTSLQLSHIAPKDLQYYFPEFAPFLNQCYYTGCCHIHEPDCAIKKEIGVSIGQERYQRYTVLYQELVQEFERRK